MHVYLKRYLVKFDCRDNQLKKSDNSGHYFHHTCPELTNYCQQKKKELEGYVEP